MHHLWLRINWKCQYVEISLMRQKCCHLVPLTMTINGATFEEHRLYTPRDMLDLVIYHFVELLMTPSLSSFALYKNVNISKTKEDMQPSNHHVSLKKYNVINFCIKWKLGKNPSSRWDLSLRRYWRLHGEQGFTIHPCLPSSSSVVRASD